MQQLPYKPGTAIKDQPVRATIKVELELTFLRIAVPSEVRAVDAKTRREYTFTLSELPREIGSDLVDRFREDFLEKCRPSLITSEVAAPASVPRTLKDISDARRQIFEDFDKEQREEEYDEDDDPEYEAMTETQSFNAGIDYALKCLGVRPSDFVKNGGNSVRKAFDKYIVNGEKEPS